MREMIGPEGRLALDANNAWTTLVDALRAAERFAPYDPWWLEEPFLPDAAAIFAELAKRTAIPLATGELESTRWPFRQFLDERSVHIIQPDATVCGGVHRMAADRADGSGLRCSGRAALGAGHTLPSGRGFTQRPCRRVLHTRSRHRQFRPARSAPSGPPRWHDASV